MTNRKFLYIVSFITIAVCFAACKKNEALSREKMTEVLYDIQLAESIYQNDAQHFKTKPSKDALIAGVLEKHGITQAQLDSSLVWYADNPEVYNRVNDSVIALLKRESERVVNQMPRHLRPSRTVNYNILPGYYYLTDANNILTFTVDSFRIQSLPDFQVEFKTLWINQGADIDLSVTYEYKDTLITNSFKLDRDSAYIISKPDYADTLKYISGYIYNHIDSLPDRTVLLYNIFVRDSIPSLHADSLNTAFIPDIAEPDTLTSEGRP